MVLEDPVWPLPFGHAAGVSTFSRTVILSTRPDVSVAGDGYMALAPVGAAVRVGALGRSRADAEAAFARALDRAVRVYAEAGLIAP